MYKERKELSFEIKKHIGVLSEGTKGWHKELNLVKWGDNPVQLDIRSWNEEHDKCSKGICISKDEVETLCELLKKIK